MVEKNNKSDVREDSERQKMNSIHQKLLQNMK